MNFVAAEKCPLCQSRLNNGECESCGYKLPDENDIKALYNYAPSDYPQEQPAVREITPEYQMEEIYPNRPEPIDFKIRNDEENTEDDHKLYQSNSDYNFLTVEDWRQFLKKYWWCLLVSFFVPVAGIYVVGWLRDEEKVDKKYYVILFLALAANVINSIAFPIFLLGYLFSGG